VFVAIPGGESNPSSVVLLLKRSYERDGFSRGIFSKYIPMENLHHLGMTIRLEGTVAA